MITKRKRTAAGMVRQAIKGCRKACMLLLLLLIFTGCSSNYYFTANRLKQRSNFLGAIENYDEFIEINKLKCDEVFLLPAGREVVIYA